MCPMSSCATTADVFRLLSNKIAVRHSLCLLHRFVSSALSASPVLSALQMCLGNYHPLCIWFPPSSLREHHRWSMMAFLCLVLVTSLVLSFPTIFLDAHCLQCLGPDLSPLASSRHCHRLHRLLNTLLSSLLRRWLLQFSSVLHCPR